MEDEQAQRLVTALSPARLSGYLTYCEGNVPVALRLHCWNTEVSGAFYGPLQYLEIVMRNGLHRQLSWLFSSDHWWDGRADLSYASIRKVEEARRKLANNHVLDPSADQMVAEFSLGMWVSLLGRGKHYEVRLWRPALHRAFPGWQGDRRALHQELTRLLHLRNRIAHHEPLYHRNLRQDYQRILRVLECMSPDIAELVHRHSSVPGVLARRPAVPAASD